MRKAAVTALFQVLIQAERRATSSFIATIFTWKAGRSEDFLKCTPNLGVLPYALKLSKTLSLEDTAVLAS